MKKKLQNYLRNFARDARGSVAIETAIIVPVLLWAMIAMWIFFDAYKTRSEVEKAAWVIGDMISRETNAIDDDYLDGAKNLFDLLSDSDSPAGLRVSVIMYSGAFEQYQLEWSKVRGDIGALEGSNMTDLADDLPGMADGERLILIQTISTYEPELNVGIGDQTMETFIFTRPRFAPQVVWEDAA